MGGETQACFTALIKGTYPKDGQRFVPKLQVSSPSHPKHPSPPAVGYLEGNLLNIAGGVAAARLAQGMNGSLVRGLRGEFFRDVKRERSVR